ncbi:hypothetical protein WDW86_09915 [Bdellovibrionota bacterium FG-2]
MKYTSKKKSEAAIENPSKRIPYDTRGDRVSRDDAWQIIRELVFIVSHYGWETEISGELSERDFARLNRRNRLLREVIGAISKFNKWDESNEATIIAKHAHPELQGIYERVVSGELSVDESRPLIISMMKGYLAPLFVGDRCPFNDDTIGKYLVKAPKDISVGTKLPTSKKGGKNAITGPATIADRALGELLGIGYRAANDSRKGDGFDHLTYRFRYSDTGMIIPGINDLPYHQIVETLLNVFHLDSKKAYSFADDLGAAPNAFPSLDDDESAGTSGAPDPEDDHQGSKCVSLPRLVLTRIRDK